MSFFKLGGVDRRHVDAQLIHVDWAVILLGFYAECQLLRAGGKQKVSGKRANQ